MCTMESMEGEPSGIEIEVFKFERKNAYKSTVTTCHAEKPGNFDFLSPFFCIILINSFPHAWKSKLPLSSPTHGGIPIDNGQI